MMTLWELSLLCWNFYRTLNVFHFSLIASTTECTIPYFQTRGRYDWGHLHASTTIKLPGIVSNWYQYVNILISLIIYQIVNEKITFGRKLLVNKQPQLQIWQNHGFNLHIVPCALEAKVDWNITDVLSICHTKMLKLLNHGDLQQEQ